MKGDVQVMWSSKNFVYRFSKHMHMDGNWERATDMEKSDSSDLKLTTK